VLRCRYIALIASVHRLGAARHTLGACNLSLAFTYNESGAALPAATNAPHPTQPNPAAAPATGLVSARFLALLAHAVRNRVRSVAGSDTALAAALRSTVHADAAPAATLSKSSAALTLCKGVGGVEASPGVVLTSRVAACMCLVPEVLDGDCGGAGASAGVGVGDGDGAAGDDGAATPKLTSLEQRVRAVLERRQASGM